MSTSASKILPLPQCELNLCSTATLLLLTPWVLTWLRSSENNLLSASKGLLTCQLSYRERVVKPISLAWNHSQDHIGVVAVNSAGKVSSPWTLIKTLESAPSGLMNFTVEQREKGRALLLQWSEPVKTNGVIKVKSTLHGRSHRSSST